eukprot:231343-Prorocentrum_minimum.AAC.1
MADAHRVRLLHKAAGPQASAAEAWQRLTAHPSSRGPEGEEGEEGEKSEGVREEAELGSRSGWGGGRTGEEAGGACGASFT